MAMGLQYYPPSVQDAPRGLTRPRLGYYLSSLVVLLSLFAFLALYLALIAGAGWLVYLAVTYPMHRIGYGTVLLKIGSVISSVMLFLFLFKGLFSRQQTETDDYLEIDEAAQPDLYAFIRRLCREVKAPFPHRIFLAPDVNAAVFYDTSLLNLIVPVKKNLLIGGGLVNALNVGEFKSVLAHEFGHFSQSTMALGRYVHVANQVIGGLVFGEDQWDDWMESWKEMDLRISVFAWIVSGIVWALKQFLKGVFLLINLFSLALSRQEEYHADRVAVSVTGSDTPVHGLVRSRHAGEALMLTLRDLEAAALNGLYTSDVYYHQARAEDLLRRVRGNPNLGKPPKLPDDPAERNWIFHPEDGRGSVWSSHPSDYEREQNAKRHYIRSVEDDRSPWLLFRDPEAVRTSLTMDLYERTFGLPPGTQLAEPERVQAFIDEQHGVSQYDARYHGLYDGRLLFPGDVHALAQGLRQPWPAQRLAQAFDRLYGGKMKEWVDRNVRHREDHQFLASVDRGHTKLKGKTFEFRGAKRRLADVKSLLKVVEMELEQDREEIAKFDQEVFLAHYQMAAALPGAQAELLSRYAFHLALQDTLRATREHLVKTSATAQALSHARQLSPEDVQRANGYFREARAALDAALRNAAALEIPPLPNSQPGMPLGRFLLGESVVHELNLTDSLPNPDWVRTLLRQMDEVQARSGGLYSKSLGEILALQERIAGAWRGAMAARPASPAVRQ